VHGEVNNLLFHAGRAGAISIIKLEGPAANLAPIVLIISFSETMLLTGSVCPQNGHFTSTLAIRYTLPKQRSYNMISTLNTWPRNDASAWHS
jgi:hypothetical protein